MTPSTAQRSLLVAYGELLRERAIPLGLIGQHDAERIFERHIMDSARAADCVPVPAGTVVDIGSGAGLPGIPFAILRPESSVILLEPARKRVAFLEFAMAELGLLNVEVRASRAEDARLACDAALARAVGDAETSWRLAEPLLAPGGSLVYFAGGSWDEAQLERLRERTSSVSVCGGGGPAQGGPLVVVRRDSH